MSGLSEYVDATVPGLWVGTKRAIGDAVGEIGCVRVPSPSVGTLEVRTFHHRLDT